MSSAAPPGAAGSGQRAAVVVVNYGSHRLLPGCLAQVGPGLADMDVVVVDSFSSTDEQRRVSQLGRTHGWTIRLLPDNPGFGSAANTGIEVARDLGCSVFVLLNPDVVVEQSVLEALVDHVRRDPQAMVSPALVDGCGRPYFRGRDLLVRTGQMRASGTDAASGTRWPWLTATCLAVPDQLWQQVGGFDAGYFLYWEDVDLSVRWRRAGGRLVLRDDLLAVHNEGGTQRPGSGRAKSTGYYYWNCRNRLQFAARHLDRRGQWRWLRVSPAATWEVVLRGGRRQLLHNPMPALAAAWGSLSGAWLLLAPASSARPAAGAVLVAHPGAELYGSDRVALETTAGLIDAGRQVVVTLPSSGPLVAELQRLGARVVICPTPVLRRSALRPAGALGLLGSAARGLLPALRLLLTTRATVVYVSTVTVPMWSLLGRVLGRRVVCHVHEAEGSAPPLLRQLLYASLLLAHDVVVNSRYSRDVLVETLPRIAGRCVVLYNGVGGPQEPPIPARVHLDRPVRLLFVGRLAPRKGPQVAIDTVAELVARGHDVRLHLLGSVFSGYEWFERDLRRRVTESGLQSRVRFLGFLTDVWPVLAEADIVLVPSTLDEPFGNTVVEALLAGRPVVVSAVGGLTEAGADYQSVRLVPPDDPVGCADAVDQLTADWARVRDGAMADAGVAARRHQPAGYRARIVSIIDARAAG